MPGGAFRVPLLAAQLGELRCRVEPSLPGLAGNDDDSVDPVFIG